ncbi:MAG: cytochrome C oxidase subunit IV family protein [Candidatus Tectimicrobiota bacterium]
MENAPGHHPNYVLIWYWLMGLAVGSVLISQLPIPHTMAVVIIFVAAAIKAVLVMWYFMHLKFEHGLIYTLIATPLVAFVILMIVLFPEIAFKWIRA